MHTEMMSQFALLGNEQLQETRGTIKVTCGVLVGMSVYASLALVSGSVGVGVAISTAGIAGHQFCR